MLTSQGICLFKILVFAYKYEIKIVGKIEKERSRSKYHT
jgi:hypothetical protein